MEETLDDLVVGSFLLSKDAEGTRRSAEAFGEGSPGEANASPARVDEPEGRYH